MILVSLQPQESENLFLSPGVLSPPKEVNQAKGALALGRARGPCCYRPSIYASICALPNPSSHLPAPSAETTLSAWEGSHKISIFQ